LNKRTWVLLMAITGTPGACRWRSLTLTSSKPRFTPTKAA
jgi:hypothetical protein